MVYDRQNEGILKERERVATHKHKHCSEKSEGYTVNA